MAVIYRMHVQSNLSQWPSTLSGAQQNILDNNFWKHIYKYNIKSIIKT